MKAPVEALEQWMSDGAWAACEDCHKLIQADDRDGLTSRAVTIFAGRHNLPAHMRRAVVERIKPLHATFWDNRLGDPTPAHPTVDGETQRSTHGS